MRVLITGGAGYVGSRLVPALLDDCHQVVVYDTFWFGDHLPNRNGLMKVKGDIRDVSHFADAVRGCDAVIHLACLSNDPSSEIDKDLTREINLEAFVPMVADARAVGVRRFINCSTSSVYGISDSPDVREDHPHVPLTLYNTYKSMCEEQLKLFAGGDFECVTVRPATICGYSPRQRLDLSVNILTNLAVNKGKITVYGGAQLRPNLHIEDMVRCYRMLLTAPSEHVAGQTFNVGAGNISIMELACLVQDEVKKFLHKEVPIEIEPIVDQRSYQVNSSKIQRMLGFVPGRGVRSAIRDLIGAFEAGLLPNPLDDANYYNVRRMKEVFADLYRDAPSSAFRPDAGMMSEIDMKRGAGQ